MARLPVPGSDDGTWGDVLNEYLDVAHNSDGTNKTIPIADGGTGATSASDARDSLELGSAATNNTGDFAQTSLNLSDLSSASSARDNLGLGDSATKDVGTAAGTVAAGDDSRITGAVQKSLVDNEGDLLIGTADDTIARLGIGSPGDVLTVSGSTAAWTATSGGSFTPPGPALKSGYYIRSLGPLNGTTLTALRCYFVPIAIERDITIDRIGMYVSGGGGGGTIIRLMVFGDTQGVPSNLIVDGGTVSCASGGAKEVTVSTSLTVGRVWVACVSDGTPSVQAYQGSGYTGADDLTQVTNTGASGYIATLASTVAPSPAPSVTYGTLTAPVIALRVV